MTDETIYEDHEDFKYKGKSKGLVDDCGDCEHCGSLPKGAKWFFDGHTYWCIHCINCNSHIYYDPILDLIFDDVLEAKWNEHIICLGEL